MTKPILAFAYGLTLFVGSSVAITTNFTRDEGYERGSPTRHPVWGGDGSSFFVEPGAGKMSLDDNAAWKAIFFKGGLGRGSNRYTVGVSFRFKRKSGVSLSQKKLGCIMIQLKNQATGQAAYLSLQRQSRNPNLYKLLFRENTFEGRTYKSSAPIDETALGFWNSSDERSHKLLMELSLKRHVDGTSTATCRIMNLKNASVVGEVEATFTTNTAYYSNKLFPVLGAAESESNTQVFERTVFSFGASAKPAKPNPTRPNMIVILMDDISTQELGCYGSIRGNTPNIDKLVNDGLKFKNAWATTTCTSTRALMMSGTYADTNGIYDNEVRISKTSDTIPKQRKTLPKSLQENGYSTFYVGKWHLPGEPQEPEWGFDSYVAYGSLGPTFPPAWRYLYEGWWWYWWKPSQISKTYKPQHSPSATWHPFIIDNGKFAPTTDTDFGPTIMCDEVISFAKKNIATGKPFFVHYAMHLPHEPWTEMKGDDGKKTAPGFEENIKMLDRVVGRLVDGLNDSGLYEDTLIFLVGDNPSSDIGKLASGPLGVHVPYMILGGSNHITRQGTTAKLTDVSDIYPTFLDFAGVGPNFIGGLDGTSLKPYLTGESEKTRTYIFAYAGPHRVIRDLQYCYDERWFWRCHESGDVFKFERLDQRQVTGAEKVALQRLKTEMKNHPPVPYAAIARTQKGADWLKIRSTGALSPWEKKTKYMLEKGLDHWLNDPGRLGY